MFDAPFQCNIYIQNNTKHTFTRSKYHPDSIFDSGHGEYKTKPAGELSPGASVKFILERSNGLSPGPEGTCKYESRDITFTLTFKCPMVDGNSADVSYSEAIKVVMTPNPLPESGHPMYVQFAIMDA